MNFDSAFAQLHTFEGGYVNNPADPGGATRFGISEAVARANGYQGDMVELPIEFAKDVYRRKYWEPLQLDAIPDELRYPLFDAAVNSGLEQSVKWLDRKSTRLNSSHIPLSRMPSSA